MSADSNALIDGIIDEARKKAEKILSDAREEAGRIESDAALQAEKKINEERRAIELRLEAIKLKEESAKRNMDRLTELKTMDASFDRVMSSVYASFSSMAEKGELDDCLVAWISEASLGLDRTEAIVSFSSAAPVSEAMLRKAEKDVFEKTGATVHLTLGSKMVSEIGIIVSSTDGKVSYNNLLSSRIRRFMKDIRKIIQEENAG